MNAKSRDSSSLHTRDYDGSTDSLHVIRADVADWLAAWGANGTATERAALIVSELASNAVQASPGVQYHLRLELHDDGSSTISVRNHTTGDGPPERSRWRPEDPLSLRGRGLAIVEALSDEVAVERQDEHIVVSARIPLVLVE